jgi:hypothetical protein
MITACNGLTEVSNGYLAFICQYFRIPGNRFLKNGHGKAMKLLCMG